MFCSKCGHKLNDGDLFCSKCGNRVAEESGEPGISGELGESGKSGESGESGIFGESGISGASDEPATPEVEQGAQSAEAASTDPQPPAVDSVADELASPAAEASKVESPAHPVANRSALKPGLKLPPKSNMKLKLPPKAPAAGVDAPPPPPGKSPDGKSRLAYQVLALSFGFLGLHNFYARRIAPACFQILLTVVAVAVLLTQGASFAACVLLAVAWPLLDIFAVHEDGRGNPWGEDFVSAPGIESIDPMVLAEFRTNKRRCIAGFFLSLILLFVIAACTGGGEVSTLGVAVFAVLGLLLPFLLVMPWYFHARSKGYAPGYSIVLALLGFLGMFMFIDGAALVVNKPFSILVGGSVFLDGILFPIAGFKVARSLLLNNGFKALPPAKKALIASAIISGFAFAIAGAVLASYVTKANDGANRGIVWMNTEENDAAEKFNRGVALMESGKFEDAAKAFRIAAEKGRADAQFNLGWCYANGKGVEKDLSEAVRWYRKAARQGFAMAEFNLGTCYATGRGIEKDIDEAVKWTRKAAEQGNDRAQFMLGVCYANGEGVEKDMAEAVRWYRKAAELGNADAQCSVGLCYYIGFGGEKDKDEGLKWIRKAASQGHTKAKSLLKELGEPEE